MQLSGIRGIYCLTVLFSLVSVNSFPSEARDLSLLSKFVPASGQWRMIPNTSIKNVLLTCKDAPVGPSIKCESSKNAIYAWNGAAYDKANHQWYFPAGGGHADYGGNEVYRFDFATLEWERITEPSPLLKGPQEGKPCPQPLTGPPSSHTYDGVIWLSKQEKIFFFGTVGFCLGAMGKATSWIFDPKTFQWTETKIFKNVPEYIRSGFDPNSGFLYVTSMSRVYEIDPDSQSIKRSSPPGSWLSAGNGVFHEGRREFFIISNLGIYKVPVYLENILPPIFVSKSPDNPLGGSEGAAYHPSTGKLVIWDGGNYIRTFDPETGKWVNLNQTSHHPTKRGRGVYSKWIYIPELDVFAGYANIDEGIWLYKL